MSENAIAQRAEHSPLDSSYFDTNADSFSASIFKELKNSPVFRPKVKKDGSVSDHDMLIVASGVVSAADAEIRKLNDRLHKMERQAGWWNAPMFQSVPSASSKAPSEGGGGADDGAPDIAEANWFAKYLTLGNFISVAVFVSAGVGGFFSWYSSDKNAELDRQLARTNQAVQRAAAAEQSEAQVEKTAKFYSDSLEKVEIARKVLADELDQAIKDKATAESKIGALQQQVTDVKNKSVSDANDKAGLLTALSRCAADGASTTSTPIKPATK